jgi:hypothetical protein
MNERRVIKVRIINPAGEFLAVRSGQWGFTPERARAAVFDYADDHVAEQIEIIHKAQGLVLKSVPLDPGEFYETCDRCAREVLPFMAFFNGKEFLCADCRSNLGSGLDHASIRI